MQSHAGFLRSASRVAMLVGAAGSVGLMLYVGRRNPSRLLMAIFTLWVLSPFVVLLACDMVSNLWPVRGRVTLHSVTMLISLATLAFYAEVAFGPTRSKMASTFVIVPPMSWLLIAIVAGIAALRSRR